MTIHFRVNLGPKQLNNQPLWFPCCLPAKEMNGMFMRSLGRRPHSYGNVAAARSFGTLRGKCVGVVGQIANDPKSQKNVWSAVGPRMLCRGPAKSLPLLRGRNWHSPFFPTAAQAVDSTDHLQHRRDGSSLQEFHQGVPLLQLVFILLSPL
ncbi:unnamed protein product [Pipistrellus nathusii]|uniref:Uncharacterized protein n=1 Tax=Pipistrellus nathusii TaxID=59473 RepID=A0ABP0AFB4_PIPNA